MELLTAIEILETHQEWRLGNRDDMIYHPKETTEAIDVVLSEVKKLPINGVVSCSADVELYRLLHWLQEPEREPAQTKFTAGMTRNVAREVELLIKH